MKDEPEEISQKLIGALEAFRGADKREDELYDELMRSVTTQGEIITKVEETKTEIAKIVVNCLSHNDIISKEERTIYYFPIRDLLQNFEEMDDPDLHFFCRWIMSAERILRGFVGFEKGGRLKQDLRFFFGELEKFAKFSTLFFPRPEAIKINVQKRWRKDELTSEDLGMAANYFTYQIPFDPKFSLEMTADFPDQRGKMVEDQVVFDWRIIFKPFFVLTMDANHPDFRPLKQLADFIGYLPEARQRFQEESRRANQIDEEHQTIFMRAIKGVDEAVGDITKLAELDYMDDSEYDFFTAKLFRWFAGQPRQLQNDYLIGHWKLGLYAEIKAQLDKVSYGLQQKEEFLQKLMLTNNQKELGELLGGRFSQYSDYFYNLCGWLRNVSQSCRRSQDQEKLQEKGVLSWLLKPKRISDFLTSDQEAQRHFQKSIFSFLCERYEKNLVYHNEERPVEKLELEVTEKKISKRLTIVRPQPTTPLFMKMKLKAERKKTDGPTIKYLTGLHYFPGLDPRSSEEKARMDLASILDEETVSLDTHLLKRHREIDANGWMGGGVANYIKKVQDKLGWDRLGDPERTARQLFEYVIFPPRKFHTYAEGVYNFHPPGSGSQYYLIYRIINLGEGLGTWLVWKYALTDHIHKGR